MIILTITTISQMNNLMRATSMMLPIFPDPFQVFATASTAVVLACPSMQVYVPNMRLLCFIMNFVMSFIVIMRVIKKTKSRLRFFNVSYDGIKTLGASAPTASTAATYQYQSRTLHLFKMIQNTRRTRMQKRLFTTQAPCVAVCGGF